MTMSAKMEKLKKLKVICHYLEPKTEEGRLESQRKIDQSYDKLFEILSIDKNI